VLASRPAGAGLLSTPDVRGSSAPARAGRRLPTVIRLRHITVALAALCMLAVAAPAAQAYTYKDVIRECYNTGHLTPGKYSRADLKKARKELPADIKEYSDCEDLINAELARSARRNGGNGPGGGAPPPLAPNPALTTPSGAVAGKQEDFDELARATAPGTRSDAPPEVTVAGSKITPTTGGLLNAAKDAEANSLPLPLILALAALAAMAVFGTIAVLRQHSPQIRRATRRLVRR
jgi:hypothetical protein